MPGTRQLVGYALFSAGGANFNTGVGTGALALNTADSNTAVGAAALLLNTTGSNRLQNFYSFTITVVPSGLASKKCSAIPLGKRMQPCDAAYRGT